jgi:ActR/RegA family two-component response regulator
MHNACWVTAKQWSPAALRVSNDSVLVQSQQLAMADVDDRVVVLSLQAGSYFDFNRVATEIWCMLAKPRRVSEIFHSLLQRHDVDAETLARDVTPFLEILITHQLVQIVCTE